MKCIKSYRRAGNTYVIGHDYDIEDADMDKHEAYLGLTLWERSKSQEGASDAQTDDQTDATGDDDASTDDATNDDASKDDSSDDASDKDAEPKKRRGLLSRKDK